MNAQHRIASVPRPTEPGFPPGDVPPRPPVAPGGFPPSEVPPPIPNEDPSGPQEPRPIDTPPGPVELPNPGPDYLPGDPSNPRPRFSALPPTAAFLLALASALTMVSAAWATTNPEPSPLPPAPAERMEPALPGARPAPRPEAPPRGGESSSERLDRTDGVIRPPENVAPQMPVLRPPGTGTMRVIPPPRQGDGDPAPPRTDERG